MPTKNLGRRRWQSLADIDMGLAEDWLPPSQVLGALAQECIERSMPMRSGSQTWDEWISTHPQGDSVRGRSLLAIPFSAQGMLSAALVLERPTAGNPFQDRDVEEVERLLSMAVGGTRLSGCVAGSSKKPNLKCVR